MKKTNLLAIGLAAILLVGCGSDSSSDNSSTGGTTQGEATQTAGSSNPSVVETEKTLLENGEYVKGVYDISFSDYLVINKYGEVNTFDMTDDDCYAKNQPGINDIINGKTLTHDAENKRFTVGDYAWYYDDSTEIQRVGSGGIIGGGKFMMNNVSLASSKYLTTVTVDEVESNICK